ncbi:MAG: 4-alpha-glucanotransferase [Clostridia bacterium]|nr:4-alpha-glucanotransferase [Clostridia bacterium]
MQLRAKIKNKRGILLPLSSLPSNYGIGSLGEEAYRFVDLLRQTNQSYWQLLPLCPVGKGNSPYASISCFAGEILYIDLDMLTCDGLLKKSEIGSESFSKNVDYDKVREFKIPLLKLAVSRFKTNNSDFLSFCKENDYWLYSFAEFMSQKEGFQKDFYLVTQYLFFSQYHRLRNYAAVSDIKIIGDIPFYVDKDSADVWSHPEIFKLGKDLTPTLVAGVPPDFFSSTGQLWGNPIYDWDYLKRTNYDWWEKRLIHNAKLYDAIRIDHFRAFANYYCIPSGSKDAKSGFWQNGVGHEFFPRVSPKIPNTMIIAEDLGGETEPPVIKLVKATGFPNMKVMQFAFSTDETNHFLPQNFGSNCVCYTGTHDNDTTLGWYQKASDGEKALFDRLVPKKYDSPVLNLISFALKSKAKIVIIPFTDYLELDSSHRINTPSTPDGNWEWRFEKDDITEKLKNKIKFI